MTNDSMQNEARALLRNLRAEAAEMSARFRELKAWSARLDERQREMAAEAERLEYAARADDVLSSMRGVIADAKRFRAELARWEADDAALRSRFFARLDQMRAECSVAGLDFDAVALTTEGARPC